MSRTGTDLSHNSGTDILISLALFCPLSWVLIKWLAWTYLVLCPVFAYYVLGPHTLTTLPRIHLTILPLAWVFLTRTKSFSENCLSLCFLNPYIASVCSVYSQSLGLGQVSQDLSEYADGVSLTTQQALHPWCCVELCRISGENQLVYVPWALPYCLPKPVYTKASFTTLTDRSAAPFDWGWQGGTRVCLIPFLLINSSEVNYGPLSDTTSSGKPCWANIRRCWTRSTWPILSNHITADGGLILSPLCG